jgi:hypothetical protein
LTFAVGGFVAARRLALLVASDPIAEKRPRWPEPLDAWSERGARVSHRRECVCLLAAGATGVAGKPVKVLRQS